MNATVEQPRHSCHEASGSGSAAVEQPRAAVATAADNIPAVDVPAVDMPGRYVPPAAVDVPAVQVPGRYVPRPAVVPDMPQGRPVRALDKPAVDVPAVQVPGRYVAPPAVVPDIPETRGRAVSVIHHGRGGWVSGWRTSR